VARRRSKLTPSLCLKANIEFSDIVQRGKHAQSGSHHFVQVFSATEPSETTAPRWQLQKCGGARRDISAVIDERVP
jgi:hypothetical protein